MSRHVKNQTVQENLASAGRTLGDLETVSGVTRFIVLSVAAIQTGAAIAVALSNIAEAIEGARRE